MVLVAATRLNENVERPAACRFALERRLLARVVQDELEALLVPELERREDLAERDARLLEDSLHALEVRHAEHSDVDSLRAGCQRWKESGRPRWGAQSEDAES